MSEQVGRYRLLEPIGRGPWGVVFSGYDPHVDRLVALQFVPTSEEITAEVHGRFWREARDWARLDHPNVAAVYEVGQDEAVLYCAYEIVDGEPLSAWMAERRPRPLGRVLSVMIQVCGALQAAHERGVVHGRLEPSHVMVSPRGYVKILHFGRQASGIEDLSEVSSPGGRLRYLAPEQIWGRLDRRSDIFSVGAILYELLTSASHLGTEDPAAQLGVLAAATPICPPLDDPRLRDGLAPILERALCRAPEGRFAEVEELREELEEVPPPHGVRRARGQSPSARPPAGAGSHPPPHPKPPRAPAATALAGPPRSALQCGHAGEAPAGVTPGPGVSRKHALGRLRLG